MAMFVALALAVAGCGGVNASKTVSPLDLLMPGVLKNDVTPATNAPSVTLPPYSNEIAVAK